MLLKTKFFLKLWCEIVFGDKSYIVRNGKLIKSTTIIKFFSDDKRNVPTKNICQNIINRCKYHLYSDNEKEVIDCSFKIVYLLSLITNKNCNFFHIVNFIDNSIDSIKRNNLFILVDYIIKKMQNEELVTLKDLQDYLVNQYAIYSNDFKGQIETKYTTKEIDDFQLYTSQYFTTINNLNYSIDGNKELKKRNDDAVELIDAIIGFLEKILQSEETITLDPILKNKCDMYYNYIPFDYTQLLRNTNEWRLSQLNEIIKCGSITPVNINVFLDYFQELLTCPEPNSMSKKNRDFYYQCISNQSHNQKMWKKQFFYKVYLAVSNNRIIYDYTYLYNYNHDFQKGINIMLSFKKKLNDLKDKFYDKNIVEDLINNRNNSKYSLDGIDENSLLFADYAYCDFEEKITNIIKYLSFQSRIYMYFSLE